MKVSRRGGRLRLRLDQVEVELLTSLLGELDALVDLDGGPGAAGDPVLARLFPDGYADESAAEEFRTMTHQALSTDRIERTRACLADISSSRDVDLTDPPVGTRWIQTLNDLRLALGTRLGIEADDTGEVDFSDQPRLVYGWLTAVQDAIVTALMR